ncbi:hypothetical protein Lal_00027474 [Lupinus albus]|nr:hypothetical protein Lal_00027474 [Lupinus albus]
MHRLTHSIIPVTSNQPVLPPTSGSWAASQKINRHFFALWKGLGAFEIDEMGTNSLHGLSVIVLKLDAT